MNLICLKSAKNNYTSSLKGAVQIFCEFLHSHKNLMLSYADMVFLGNSIIL